MEIELQSVIANKTAKFLAIIMKIVRACIFPTAIYGHEGWTLTTADEKKINAFETKCYRRILRIPWIAKRKNTEILKELKVGQDL